MKAEDRLAYIQKCTEMADYYRRLGLRHRAAKYERFGQAVQLDDLPADRTIKIKKASDEKPRVPNQGRSKLLSPRPRAPSTV